MSQRTHLLTALPASLSLCFVTSAMPDELRVLFNFAQPEAALAWQPVNDGVMGGVSDGRFKIIDEGTLEFFGTLFQPWLLMTVAFEFGFFHHVMGTPWELLLADHSVSRGRIWVLVLAAVFLAPIPSGLILRR